MLQLFLAIILAILAVVLFFLAFKARQNAGLPSGKIIYTDASQWGKVEKPLYDPNLRLTGKPDYLVKQGQQVIPVEVKSRHAPQAPHDSHIYQLGAYCLLVEHEYKQRPSHGILHYSDKSFSIDFTREFEKTLKATIREIQGCVSKEPLERSHQDGRRCVHCGYRSTCDQSLRI
jgi:CRISPR-associated exonuclease Cas4